MRRRGHHPSAAATFRAPALYRPIFQVSTYGQIWMSTEARTILGSDSGSVSSHRCAQNSGGGNDMDSGMRREPMRRSTRILSDGFRAAVSRWSIAAVAVVALLVGLGAGSPAAADDCVALG